MYHLDKHNCKRNVLCNYKQCLMKRSFKYCHSILNTSTPQHLNASTPQQLNNQTIKQPNNSAPQHLNTSTPQEFRAKSLLKLNCFFDFFVIDKGALLPISPSCITSLLRLTRWNQFFECLTHISCSWVEKPTMYHMHQLTCLISIFKKRNPQ